MLLRRHKGAGKASETEIKKTVEPKEEPKKVVSKKK